uniref:Uncharacterized protein n=1 Tax=Panagrolaimus superbus TaxID=310955 RepID=A0A914YI23_9BILA
MPKVHIEFCDRIILEENEDGSMVGLVGVDFTKCTHEGENLVNALKKTLERVLVELHKGLDETGIFRYIVRSDHLVSGAFPMQASFFYPMEADEMFVRLLELTKSQNMEKFFKDDILFEIVYTPRDYSDEVDFED